MAMHIAALGTTSTVTTGRRLSTRAMHIAALRAAIGKITRTVAAARRTATRAMHRVAARAAIGNMACSVTIARRTSTRAMPFSAQGGVQGSDWQYDQYGDDHKKDIDQGNAQSGAQGSNLQHDQFGDAICSTTARWRRQRGKDKCEPDVYSFHSH